MLSQVVFNDEIPPLCYLTDLSTNGTYFRPAAAMPATWSKVGKGKTVLLSNGDELEIRRVATFTFKQRLCQNELSFAFDDFPSRLWKLSNRQLGAGSFGTIVMAYTKDNAQAACKLLKKHDRPSDNDWQREFEVLRRVSHVRPP